MAATVINGLDDLKSRVGQELGVSDWLEVTQERINEFADVTGDHQFIHVDPEKAKQTPFGGTIAHGLFSLSIGPALSYDMWTVEGVAFALNYGYNKIRFPAPLPVGSQVRMRATLAEVAEIAGGAQFVVTQTFEREGADKPVCVADQVVRIYFG
jgi:acyl dehydratase